MKPSLALWPMLFLLSSCDGGSSSDKAKPSGARHDSGAAGLAAGGDGGVGAQDAAAAGAGADVASPPVVVENDSFETARVLPLGDHGVGLHTVEHMDQLDYYAFDVEAGHFYDVRTTSGGFSVDTVVTVYDPGRSAIVTNDSGSIWAGDDIDARVVMHAPSSGRFFVVVRNKSEVISPVTGEHTSGYYTLVASELTPTTDGVAFDAEGGDGPASMLPFSLDFGSGYSYVTVIGSLGPGGRDDFPFAGTGGHALIGHLHASGPEGNGSTEHSATFAVQDAAGTLLARIDQGKGQVQLHPPLADDAQYTFSVQASGDAAGLDDFYVADLVMMPENPGELDEQQNDSLVGADVLMMDRSPTYERGRVLCKLPSADVDYFEFDVQTGDRVTAVCEAASAGSGVVGLHVELRDDGDTVLEQQMEGADVQLSLPEHVAPHGGAYYLRVTAGSQKMDLPADWARCAVILRR